MSIPNTLSNNHMELLKYLHYCEPMANLIDDIMIILNMDLQIKFINHFSKSFFNIKNNTLDANFATFEHIDQSFFIITNNLKKLDYIVCTTLQFNTTCTFHMYKEEIQWTVTYLLDQAKSPIGILLVGKLQSLKLNQNKIDYLQNCLDTIIDTVPSSLYWKNKQGVYLGCNNSVVKQAKLRSKQDIIGKTDHELWLEQENTFWQQDQQVLASNTMIEFQESVIVDGKKYYFLSIKSPLKDSEGQTIGVIGNSVDITEILLAKEQAEVASHAKTEFIYNMRHDLRNALAGILGCSELLTTETDIIKSNQIAAMLTTSSKQLLKFLNQVLESINTASGEMPILKKQFNLIETLEEVVNLHMAKAFEKKLTLSLSFSDDIPKLVVGDPVRIYRIVLEILSNALKFTDHGYVHVAASIAKKTGRDLVVQIFIEDSGIGIPEDSHHKIFERFKRLTPSYQGIYPGSGLGLFIAKQFIDDLQGEIYVESELNKGTKFICVLPLKITLLEDPFTITRPLFKKISSEDFFPVESSPAGEC